LLLLKWGLKITQRRLENWLKGLQRAGKPTLVRFDGLSRFSYLIPHPHGPRPEVSHIQRKEILLVVSLCAVNIPRTANLGIQDCYAIADCRSVFDI
jgi:hypothetical protein